MSPILINLYPDGHEICKNLIFLGRSGVKIIQDLKIAYISGL
jgi:hypothetical protein